MQEYQRVQSLLEGTQDKLAHSESNNKQLQQNRCKVCPFDVISA